jgi:YVTN family beta-propeller protein
VTPIRTATNTAGKPIKVRRYPLGIAITPDGKTAYVFYNNSKMVTPINTATNTAGKPIKVGRKPADIAITPQPASLLRSPPRRPKRATETRDSP